MSVNKCQATVCFVMTFFSCHCFCCFFFYLFLLFISQQYAMGKMKYRNRFSLSGSWRPRIRVSQVLITIQNPSQKVWLLVTYMYTKVYKNFLKMVISEAHVYFTCFSQLATSQPIELDIFRNLLRKCMKPCWVKLVIRLIFSIKLQW